ncbi:MAG: hypothetical protein WC142_03085 [Bacteroidales bacterium]|jgi:hypothetical protein|nr:hypothetical protein [Bacteroidales bacterium]MDD2688332.1 hypothetical protein [Bacteroidales bacterium]MDD3330607.1 hypothetical protein [Bacteroidales bacterium]MDD3691031.1 hypothetical protein [Bacteroidales bacterium]MDD4045099.1 hypothetical protein [Bacteroidales bacterium]
MKLFRKIFTLCALTIFVTYSVGICFSIHHCEHCQTNKIYLLHHPDCCEASAYEHHHANNTSETNHTSACCSDLTTHKTDQKTHCHNHCCITNFKYFKLDFLYHLPEAYSLYAFHSLPIELTDFDLVSEWHQELIHTVDKKPPLGEIPPLKQGGSLYLIATHQQTLYA